MVWVNTPFESAFFHAALPAVVLCFAVEI